MTWLSSGARRKRINHAAQADLAGAVSGEADLEGAAVAVAAAECRVTRSAPNAQLLRTQLSHGSLSTPDTRRHSA